MRSMLHTPASVVIQYGSCVHPMWLYLAYINIWLLSEKIFQPLLTFQHFCHAIISGSTSNENLQTALKVLITNIGACSISHDFYPLIFNFNALDYSMML